MKKTRAVLLFALLLSFLAAALGLAEPIYSEDFGRGRSLKELGFSGFHPSFWTLDLKGRYMKGLAPGGMDHAAEIYTPRFAASRRNAELGVEWKTDFLFAESRHWSEEELAVGLADNRGAVLYRLSISPTRHGKEEGFTLAFYKAGRPREALLKKALWKTLLPGWHTFGMIFAPPEAGGGIRVLGEGKEVLSLRDLTYLDFAGLRFAYRAARRRRAVGIDEILVAVERPQSQDTTPPVTSHDYENEGGWANQPVTINLTAADEGSGVANTYYKINGDPVQTGTTITLTQDGIHEISYWSVDNAGNTEEAKTLTVKLDATPPVVTAVITPAANPAGWHNTPISVSFEATDNLSGVVEASPSVTLATEGAGQKVTGFAVDAAGNRAEAEVAVNIDLTPPVILELTPNGVWLSETRPVITASFLEELSGIGEAELILDGEKIEEGLVLTPNTLTYTPAADLGSGSHTLGLSLRDRAGNEASSSASFVIDPAIPPIPPDPAEVAPPLDRTAFTDLFSATSFLYSGDDPIQKGVLPETIEPRRAAVIRGKVLTAEGSPLPGVTLSVLGHPEYGYTVSRQDGCFDLAVNGGGPLTLKYERPGYLPAQRQVRVPWQDYAQAPDVVMIKPDPEVSEVRMDSPEMQIARGSVITDKDGTRQATILIPPGTKLEGLNLSTLHIRATEYSVGERGPLAMPAELPPQVGYTYCVELSADEAEEVRFDRPVYFYVENFLNFPVGTPVPVGYYDRAKGVWVPSRNGRVIRIVGLNDGLAQVDLDGNGLPAGEEGLNQLGFTADELRKLAELYPVGQSLWRVPVTHFTPWDCNWPYGPPEGARPPVQKICKGEENLDDPNPDCGSFIEIQNQSLREAVGLSGIPYTLNYASDRVPGRLSANMLEISLSEETLPPDAKRIELEIDIAGLQYTESFPAAPNLVCIFAWNGKDAYGRLLQGRNPVKVRLGYAYDAIYQEPMELTQTFASFSGIPITMLRARQELILWQEQSTSIYAPKTLGTWDARGASLGGWTLDVHHTYDPIGRVLYLGDGSRRSAASIQYLQLETVLPAKRLIVPCFVGPSGVPADLGHAGSLVAAPDGSVYLVDVGDNVVRRLFPDGTLTIVAGNGERQYTGDGGPATATGLYPRDIALGSDGSLYIADDYNHRVYRVGTNGLISTIAGTGEPGFSGDGGPAIAAQLREPSGLAVGPDGSLYIADTGNGRIRRISPDGIITTAAGNGEWESTDDDGPALTVGISPCDIAVGPDGSIYIAEEYRDRVRRVRPDGIVNTVTHVSTPSALAVGADGTLYIFSNGRLYYLGTDGEMALIAGGGELDISFWADFKGPATQAHLDFYSSDSGVALGPDGCIWLSSGNLYLVRPVLPGYNANEFLVPSADGSALYRFNAVGRHLGTINALTGATIHIFHYDGVGRLIGIEDGDGNITTIERDSSGNPTAVVGPYGQRTNLTLNAEGYLQSITNPAGETVRFTYTDDGLLTELFDPRGGVHRFTYDGSGRLIWDEDPAGGYTILAREETKEGFKITRTEAVDETTEKVTIYLVEDLPEGGERRVESGCCGNPSTTIAGPDGSTVTTAADGTIVTIVQGADPRFGMQAPIIKSMTIETPGGLVYTQTAEREAVLETPDDPLSLRTLTDTITINGRIYTSVYDASTRCITTTTPEGRESFTYLDEKGRIVRTEVPGLAPVAFEYDERGRLVTITEGEGLEARVNRLEYNAEGYIARTIDPLGRVTSFEYDAAGRVVTEILPDGRRIPYTYDAHGNVTSITPPGRPPHTFTYTPVDLEETYNPPPVSGGGTNQTRYDYNFNRQLIQITRPDGKTVGFAYDTMGRLVTVSTPEGEIGCLYDATSGNLTDIIAVDGGALSYTYDGSLLTGVRWQGRITGSVGYEYDDDFRVKTLSVNGSQPVEYGYDEDGLLTSAGGLVLERDPANGMLLGTRLGDVTDEYAYNAFGDITDYVARYQGAEIYHVHQEMDGLGRIISKRETVLGETHTYEYGYDQAGRLVDVYKDGVLISHYDYDPNGNRLAHVTPGGTFYGTYDDQDRMLSYGGAVYEYTANGELLHKTDTEGITQYTYDVLGNLTSVVLPDGTKIDYINDSAYRIIGKKVNGTLVQGFLYQDALKPIAELDASGNIIARFVYGTNLDVPDYMIVEISTYSPEPRHVEVLSGSDGDLLGMAHPSAVAWSHSTQLS